MSAARCWIGRDWRIQGLVLAVCFARCLAAAEPVDLSEPALQFHHEAFVFDAHSNLVRALLKRPADGVDSVDLTRFQQGLHTDFPRLRQGGISAQFFATYVSSDSVKQGTAVAETLEQIEATKRLLHRYPGFWKLTTNTAEIRQAGQQGRMAVLLAIENGDAISGSLAVLRSFHQSGVRCLALTHDDTHGWADAALDRARHGGLSEFGEQVIAEANRLGIVLDLSHASEATIQDTLGLTTAPVLFSHSGTKAIASHPRNLSDEILRSVAKNGGVVHVNFFAGFLTQATVDAYHRRSEAAHALRRTFRSEEQYRLAIDRWLEENPLPTTTVSDVVDHIDHIVSVAGIDHVGLGSNFDGIVSVPRDLNDVSCFPRITQELMNRGYEPDQIRKILGGNTLRVLTAVERAATTGGHPLQSVTLRSDDSSNQ